MSQPSIENYIERHIEWSKRTFGPANRTEAILKHIAKELEEVRADDRDIFEWADIIILAIDGAWRAGATPASIAATLEQKLKINNGRDWPDWRTANPNEPIEHKR